MRVLIIILILFSSCKAQQISSERTLRDSVVIREIEKEIVIPRFEGKSQTINIDSLRMLLKSGVNRELIEKTIFREDPDTKLKVGILIDELGNLTAVCEKQEEVMKVLLEERDFYRYEFERIIERERKNIFQKAGEWLKYTLIGFALIVLVMLFLRFRK